MDPEIFSQRTSVGGRYIGTDDIGSVSAVYEERFKAIPYERIKGPQVIDR